MLRELRNIVFHFKRPLTADDHALLARDSIWLQTRVQMTIERRKASDAL
jgi:hypothetical protein